MDFIHVYNRVEEIRELAERDPEAAHAREDELYKDLLECILADTSENSPLHSMITMTLSTKRIDFSRWCG